MTRLIVNVEGQTEETFVNEILRRHLSGHGYTEVTAKLIGHARKRLNRGGIKSWQSAKKDILQRLKGDNGCIATLMVDYYALPATGQDAWPGRDAPVGLSAQQKGKRVEQALCDEICAEFDVAPDQCRFIPYVMMHEFEGLLFSDCQRFATGVGKPNLQPQLQQIRAAFDNPEEINDSVQTAPSKRVLNLMPDYQKTFFGPLAAMEIGLDRIRAECPNFNDWVTRLESRGNMVG